MPTARWWKECYEAERISLGAKGLEALFEHAPRISFPTKGAIIFPHTRLSASGHIVAAAALAVIESGCESVLALGVLHLGERRGDRSLRGIHGPGAPFDKGIWRDEFSLDNFEALLGVAARRAGRPAPELIARYPFLAGEFPETLPGFDELLALADGNAGLVATADMIHHGVGYGTPEKMWRADTYPTTAGWVTREIQRQLAALRRKNFSAFLSKCETAHSDFRDSGPVLAALFSSRVKSSVLDVTLVDYSDVLNAEKPTWVAATLAKYGGLIPLTPTSLPAGRGAF